jgi:hypothetical protein
MEEEQGLPLMRAYFTSKEIEPIVQEIVTQSPSTNWVLAPLEQSGLFPSSHATRRNFSFVWYTFSIQPVPDQQVFVKN